MVSVSNVSAGQAGTYYAQDGYYTAASGEWQGKGAEALGLEGAVEQADFEKIIAGKSPQGEQLVKAGVNGDHRAGQDLT